MTQIKALAGSNNNIRRRRIKKNGRKRLFPEKKDESSLLSPPLKPSFLMQIIKDGDCVKILISAEFKNPDRRRSRILKLRPEVVSAILEAAIPAGVELEDAERRSVEGRLNPGRRVRFAYGRDAMGGEDD